MSAQHKAVPTKQTSFADRLRAQREVAGLSQAQLAAQIGVSQTAIGQWERSTTAPRGRNVNALALALNVDADELRGTANAAQPNEQLAVAAPSAASELLMAELIIVTMLGALTAEQKVVVWAQLEAAGVAGADMIRSSERRAAIIAGSAA